MCFLDGVEMAHDLRDYGRSGYKYKLDDGVSPWVAFVIFVVFVMAALALWKYLPGWWNGA